MSDAAIVLCGGRSRRMAHDKASLPFGHETMLERIVRTISKVIDEIWVVAREGQSVPGGFRIVRDSAEGLGPLAGICAGLEAISAERAFVTACDMPLLRADYVSRLLSLSRGYPIAVPVIGANTMVTSAVYSRGVLPIARTLLSEGRSRPLFLVEAVDARIVEEDQLRDIDPNLESLYDCNTPSAYREALRSAGVDVDGV